VDLSVAFLLILRRFHFCFEMPADAFISARTIRTSTATYTTAISSSTSISANTAAKATSTDCTTSKFQRGKGAATRFLCISSKCTSSGGTQWIGPRC
jgi:hypothetical protein